MNDETSEYVRKRVAYYKELVAAFTKTEIEHTKAKSTSPIAILFIIGIIKFFNIPILSFQGVLLTTAAFLFFVCTILISKTFKTNSRHVENVLNDDNKKSEITRTKLNSTDGFMDICFFIGYFCLFLSLFF